MIEHFDDAWAELTSEGAAFAMSDIEVRGIPMRVFDGAPTTMRSLWELARNYGDKTYIVYEDERYTYAEIDARVRALAALLRDEYGVGVGDRVAIAMRNYPEWVVGYWATVAIGAAVVGMNAWWTSHEMEFGLADSRPKVLIADDERVERVLPVLDALRADARLHVIAVRSDAELPDDASRWDDVVKPGSAPAGLPDAEIDPDDDVTIFYTSGTTGFPKGAQLTHRGSIHNVMNLAFMSTVSGLAEAQSAGANANAAAPAAPPTTPVFMAPTPLFHVTANNCLLQPCTLAGGTIVFMYKWDAGRALELIERERVTNFSGVPTMSREMLMHPDWDRRDTSSVKGMGGGGAPIQPDLVEKIDRSLSGGGPSTGYGLTETHGIVTANQAKLYTAKPESCGRVVPTLDARLEHADGTIASGPDAIGELCVRGPIVIKGYLNRPDATAESIIDGWFHTGDIGDLDDQG
ncbi:MAG: class I adenylate-forming enzyme family protein, partial [Ilumatobacter sp.]